MKKLIVTADDFGYSRELNAAVIKAYRGGVLRYASLMVNRPAASEAAAMARAHPGLGVGLHLELCRDSPALWGLRYCFGRRERARLEGEISEQIERFLRLGLKPTHADGHFNIHVHPVIFPVLARLARRHGIPRLRLPGGESGPCLDFERSRGSWSRVPAALGLSGVFGALGAWLRPMARGLMIPERTYGLLRSGMMTEEYLLWLISMLPAGSTEIYFHPTSDPASAVDDKPTATHHTVTELESLLSPRVREALERSGVELAGEPQAAAVPGGPPPAG